MPKPTNSFTTLGGVPVNYARPPLATYGTRGKAYTFYADAGFEKQFDVFFTELWQRHPLGKAEVITSAGAYVDKPGQHANGRALDIDAIFWAGRDFVTLKYPNDKRFYLGVEALLKKHFGTVLSYNYDAAHHDHFHVDNGTSVGFGAGKKTTALFVGAALNHVFGRAVKEGGALTEEMKNALREVLVENGIPTDLSVGANYFAWLELVADRAWGTGLMPATTEIVADLVEDETDLRQVFRSVLHLVNSRLVEHPDRKEIETAVSYFGERALTALESAPAPAGEGPLVAPGPESVPFTTPPSQSQTTDKKGASTTSGLKGRKIAAGTAAYVIEATEEVSAKRDNKPLGNKSLAHRRTAKAGVITVEQPDYCWKDRKLPNATLFENHPGFGNSPDVFKGKGTYFGKSDNMDEGTGSPLWGTVHTNSSVFGVSVKRQRLLDEGLAVEGPGKILKATEKGLSAMIEVYFPKTARMARLPLVDVGPGAQIQAVADLTVAATAFLQARNEEGKNEDGTGPKKSLANIEVHCRIIA